MLHKVGAVEILQTVFEKNLALTMSYLSQRQWHIARAVLIEVRQDSFDVRISPRKKSQLPLGVDQSVGISFRYEYGEDKFIFDTTVTAIKSSDLSQDETIVLAMPQQIEIIRRNSFERVEVPASLRVDVEIWRRDYICVGDKMTTAHTCQGWEAKLIDISVEGLKIAIASSQGPDLEKGQFVGLRFTPLPHETPLMFNAYVRNVSEDDNGVVYLGLEMVGLEASPEGRMVLQRFCSIVEQYQQMAVNEAGQPANKTIQI